MDSIMSVAGLPAAHKASTNSFNFHSTDPIISSLATLAHDSLQDHISDYADVHRWIDSFFDKLDLKGTSTGGGTASRPAMSELMKTPGRKRVVGKNSTNHSTPSTLAAAKKDPFATLLFPTGPSKDKENTLASPARTGTPKRVLSPALSKKTSGIPLSPMRIGSPRPNTSKPRAQQQQPSSSLRAPTPIASPAPVIARDFAEPAARTLTQLQEEIERNDVADLSNVIEEEEEEEEDAEGNDEAPSAQTKSVETAAPVESVEVSAIAPEEDKAELSMIGEEEEEEQEEEEERENEEGEDQRDDPEEASTRPKSLTGFAETSTFVVPETQSSAINVASPVRPKVAVIPASLPVPVLSPQSRSVSGASSVAPDADDDETVPLNDGPSTLRSVSADGSLSSSLPASSTTRTPGGSSSRFAAVGSYSAAKIGMGNINIGSSPPAASSATFAGPSHNFRMSSGGTQQLNFVGLPKKSMGLQLGRNWTTSNSGTSDSQGSSQGRQSFATAPSSSSFDTSNSGSTTATGAIKRKSLTGPDVSSKMTKVSRGSEVGGDPPLSKIEQIQSRLQTLNSRNSVVPGNHRMSSAGTFNSSLFPTTSKPLSGSSSSAFIAQAHSQPSVKPAAMAPPPSSISATVSSNTAPPEGPTAVSSNGVVRRPSVMERVKSFEYSSSMQDHLNPPSPSKIPSAFNRAVSPGGAQSPRGLASPTFGPASPRPLTRSTTSGLPLSTFGSPKMTSSSSFSPMMGSPRAIPSAFFRSPPVSSAAAPSLPSLSSFRAPPAPIPAPASLPLAAVSPPRSNTITQSTTPPGSPPAINFQSIFQRFAAPRESQEVPHAMPFEQKPRKKDSIIVISDDEDEDDYGRDEDVEEDEEDEDDEEEEPSIRPVENSLASVDRERAERAEAKAIAERAREMEEQDAEREREEAAKKRLPSLPKPQLLTRDESDEDDDDFEEEDEVMIEAATSKKSTNTIVKKATKEDLRVRTSPSKIVMPGTFGASLVAAAASSNQNTPHESEVEDDEDGEDDGDDERDEDRTNMSRMSSATGTFSFAQPLGAFKPSKPTAMQKQRSTSSSLASSVSSTTALGLNQSIGNGATKKLTAAAKAKQAQSAAAAAKKEKDDAERKKAMRDLQERRVQAQKKKQELEQKKQETERRAKAEELEKKRKDREEAVAKAKAAAARLAAKQKAQAEEENSKKRKMEQETKVPLKKAATQSSRPMTASSSSHRISSLAASQSRPTSTVPGNPLAKSGGPTSMIGQKFMSNQIRLPESSTNAQASSSRPPLGASTTVPKPFGLSASQGAARNAAPQASALRPPPSAHKPDPEPYQELPEIDSEYSDSDDEAHEKKVAAFPRWAQSPVLTHQLLEQQKINPDDIFGPIPALSIADMFRNSQSTARLRVRTSSAQWDGIDALTRTDMERYHKAMGFSKTPASNLGVSTSSATNGNNAYEGEGADSRK
ncbi:hypothetical protein JCM11491_002914 [Sporobolomyces phaffii]